MKILFSTAAGVAMGTLLYARYFGNAHDWDWQRAMFIGVCSGVLATILLKIKEK
jgi:hypothetical protein